MSDQWDANFMAALRENLPGGESITELSSDTALADLGLDSINMISMMMRLEADYDISFPDDALSFETFATPATLWNLVSGLRVSESRS